MLSFPIFPFLNLSNLLINCEKLFVNVIYMSLKKKNKERKFSTNSLVSKPLQVLRIES